MSSNLNNNFEIIKNPWFDKFVCEIKNTEKNLKISTPYIKEQVVLEIAKNIKKNVKIELITDIKNSFNGSLDIGAVDNLIQIGTDLRSYSKLHSKIFIFDDRKIYVGSSNLTNSGLNSNYEYGIIIKENFLIKNIIKDFDDIFSSNDTTKLNQENLMILKKLIENLKANNKFNNFYTDNLELILTDKDIESSLTGWKKEIFNILNNLEIEIFHLIDLYNFKENLKNKYPENNNIEAKIRQQIQELRDLGLVEFLGDGKYKKLWKNSNNSKI